MLEVIIFMTLGAVIVLAVLWLLGASRRSAPRHRRLFDTKWISLQVLSFGLALLTMGAVVWLAFALTRVVVEDAALVADMPFMMLFTSVFAIFIMPIKSFYERAASNFFYHQVYSTEEFYNKLNQILVSSSQIEEIFHKTSAHIANTFALTRVVTAAHLFDDRVMIGHSRSASSQGAINAENKLILYKNTIKNLEQIKAVGIIRTGDLTDETVRKELEAEGVRLLLLFRLDNLFSGAMLLGGSRGLARKSKYGLRSRRGLTDRDVKVIESVANELLVSVEGAMAVEEARRANENLQEKIEAATKRLRTSNSRLRQLDATKDEFISMASHQLRTPLTSVKGYLSMVLEGDAGSITKTQKQFLHEAFLSSERMVRLIGDFLNVSRLQTGKFIIDKKPVDLKKLVAEEVSTLTVTAAARGLKLEYQKPEIFPLLNLDEDKFRQVIMNFIDNAIFYSHEGGAVQVRLEVVEGRAIFTVHDSGIGVPKNEQKQLFSKFYRASNARKQRPDGTGIGIYLAKTVVDAHDGMVIFESEENKGSTFGFSLPIALTIDDTE